MTVLEALTTSFSDQYLCPPVFVGKYKSLWFYFSVSLMGYSRSQYILIKVFFWGGEGRNPKVTWQDPLCQFIFNWRIIVLQYCVGFCHTTWRIRHTHIHTHPPAWALFPPFISFWHLFFMFWLLGIYIVYKLSSPINGIIISRFPCF